MSETGLAVLLSSSALPWLGLQHPPTSLGRTLILWGDTALLGLPRCLEHLQSPGCSGSVRWSELPDHPHPGLFDSSAEAAYWLWIIATTAEKSFIENECFVTLRKG